MYIPPNCSTLDKLTDIPQIRLCLQGAPGSGKTWAALTFPKPIVFSLDRGLGAHTGRNDVTEIPVWDSNFCKTLDPNYRASRLRDVILKFFDKEAPKLEPDQTLIIDGSTGLQNAYHLWYQANPTITASGSIDAFAEWKLKLKFFGDIMSTLKSLKCNVVYLCHEVEKKESDGSYRGKIRPLLTGAFGDELVSHFTDAFRQLASSKPDLTKYDEKKLAPWNMNKEQFTSWVNSFPRDTVYYWSLASNDECDLKCSSLKPNYPSLMPATYQAFMDNHKISTLS